MILSGLKQGDRRIVTATIPEGYSWVGWIGDTQYLDDPTAESTIVTMPNNHVNITAEFEYMIFLITYGLLYNWHAVNNTKGITASGWEIMSASQWNSIISIYGGFELKYPSLDYWQGITECTNSSLLSMIGVNRKSSDSFHVFGNAEFIWTKTENSSIYAHYICIVTGSNSVSQSYMSKQFGCGIRAVKISTSLSEGQTGIYTGNNGRVYQTICRNGMEITTNNIAETKYRDGSLITEIQDFSEFWNDQDGALSAFNNDWSRV